MFHDLLVGPSLGSYYRLPTLMEYNLKNIEVMADRGMTDWLRLLSHRSA